MEVFGGLQMVIKRALSRGGVRTVLEVQFMHKKADRLTSVHEEYLMHIQSCKHDPAEVTLSELSARFL